MCRFHCPCLLTHIHSPFSLFSTSVPKQTNKQTNSLVQYGIPVRDILSTIQQSDSIRKKRMQSLQGYFNGPQWDFVHVGLEKASKALRFKHNKDKKNQHTSSTNGKKRSKSNKKNKTKNRSINNMVYAAAASA